MLLHPPAPGVALITIIVTRIGDQFPIMLDVNLLENVSVLKPLCAVNVFQYFLKILLIPKLFLKSESIAI